MEGTGGKVHTGIDWAHERHQVCTVDDRGEVLGERVFEHNALELATMCDWLIGLAGGSATNVDVAIETPHGIVVETLLERGIAVFAINPKQLDRFRDRFSMSGAKDDRRDARVLADSLRTDRRAFRHLVADDPLVVQIREWSRIHDELQREEVQLINRLREQLRRYFPQFLEVAPDLGTPWSIDLWRLVPTPAVARRVRASTIQRLLKQRRIRRIDAQTVLGILRKPAMTVAPGTIAAATAHIDLLCERVSVLNEQTKRCRRRIEELLDQLAPNDASGKTGEQHVVTIALSLPGVGPIVVAALLAEAAKPLMAGDYPALRSLSGTAPVTKRSGRTVIVQRRHGCNPRLANAVYHWARVASQHDPVAKARYLALRGRGCSHGRALRAVGDALLRVLCAMIRSGTLFDPQRRVAA